MIRTEAHRWRVPPGVPRLGVLLSRAPQRLRQALAAFALSRPAGSRLRRRVITDGVRVGVELLNRRELDRLLGLWHPACETQIGPGFPLDHESVYRGRSGFRAMLANWWAVGNPSFVATEILDMGGPCVAVRVSVRVTGTLSGAPTNAEDVWTYRFERGFVVTQRLSREGWESAPEQLAAMQR